MKSLWTPGQVLDEYVKVWNDFYTHHELPRCGGIELCLDGTSYFIYLYPDRIVRKETTDLPVRVSLTCSVSDWVRLASGRLNPLWGIISGRLKFRGKLSFFSALPKVDFRYYLRSEDPVSRFEKRPRRYWKVPRQILVINGSPRAQEGYTNLLLGHFVKGMQKVCENVKVIQLRDFNLNECCGCWYCWQRGEGKCIYDSKDDGRRLLLLMEESDLIVLAFPLYSDGLPAGLKKLIDRRVAALKPFMENGIWKTRHPRRVLKEQALAVLSVSGFTEKDHFQAVKAYFQALSHNWHMPVVGEIYRPAAMALFNNPLCYDYQQLILEQIGLAGEQLAKGGHISGNIKKRIERDYIAVGKFQGTANYYWTIRLINPDMGAY